MSAVIGGNVTLDAFSAENVTPCHCETLRRDALEFPDRSIICCSCGRVYIARMGEWVPAKTNGEVSRNEPRCSGLPV